MTGGCSSGPCHAPTVLWVPGHPGGQPTVPEFRSGYGPATEIAAVTLCDLVLKQLIEAGNCRAVIDRCCPLEQVIDATRYVESEQQTGNVVLTVSGGRGP